MLGYLLISAVKNDASWNTRPCPLVSTAHIYVFRGVLATALFHVAPVLGGGVFSKEVAPPALFTLREACRVPCTSTRPGIRHFTVALPVGLQRNLGVV